MNIDQLKQDLCKQMAIIDLIERSQNKAKVIATSNTYYYALFSNDRQMQADVDKQNKVTQRLYNYLERLRS